MVGSITCIMKLALTLFIIFSLKIPHYHLVEATQAAKPILGEYYREPETTAPIPFHLIKNFVQSIRQDHYGLALKTKFLSYAILLFGFYVAWNIGADGVTSAMGTSVGSGALTLRSCVDCCGVGVFRGIVDGNSCD